MVVKLSLVPGGKVSKGSGSLSLLNQALGPVSRVRVTHQPPGSPSGIVDMKPDLPQRAGLADVGKEVVLVACAGLVAKFREVCHGDHGITGSSVLRVPLPAALVSGKDPLTGDNSRVRGVHLQVISGGRPTDPAGCSKKVDGIHKVLVQ